MSTDTQMRSALERVIGDTGVDVQQDLRQVEEKATRVSRRRRSATVVGVVAVVAVAVVAVVTLQRGNDPSVATPTRSVEVKRHVGAGGQIFGPLMGSSNDTLTQAQYDTEPEFIALFVEDGGSLRSVGYVKRSDALIQGEDGTYSWSNEFLPVYSENGSTVVGQFVGHHTFLTVDAGRVNGRAATLQPDEQPSNAWYDQRVGSCAAAYLGSAGPAHGETISVFDQTALAAIEMPIAQFCSEQAALSPDPSGDLLATFTVASGHVTATYYRLNRTIQNGHETASQGALVPFDEAQQIIAVQRAASSPSQNP